MEEDAMEPKLRRSLYKDCCFWLLILSCVCLVSCTFIWLGVDWSGTSLDLSTYKSLFSVMVPTYAFILLMQVIQYSLVHQPQLTSIFHSVLGSFIVWSLGGQLAGCCLRINDVFKLSVVLLLMLLVQTAAVCLLIYSGLYLKCFFTDIDVVIVNIKPDKKCSE